MDTLYKVSIGGQEYELPADWVMPWVYGVADAQPGGRQPLEVIDVGAPEETRRMQALQIGHAQRWFQYLYLVRGGDS